MVFNNFETTKRVNFTLIHFPFYALISGKEGGKKWGGLIAESVGVMIYMTGRMFSLKFCFIMRILLCVLWLPPHGVVWDV
jgi:hypothetical protein